MIAPCKGCEKRTPGCHDRCPDYKVFRDWIDAGNRERQKEHDGHVPLAREILRKMKSTKGVKW